MSDDIRSVVAIIREKRRNEKKVHSIFIKKVVTEFSCQSKNRYFRS